MKVYTDVEAIKCLPILLDEAQRDGSVGIRRNDGRTFVIAPKSCEASPLDVQGVDLGLTTEEIISYVHEGRRQTS